jgi:hypothetical protein
MPDAADQIARIKGLSTPDLQRMLSEPGAWSPDMVHAAATELALRKAIPRYYRSLRRRQEEQGMKVYRRIFGFRNLFPFDEEGRFRLRFLALMVALAEFIRAALTIFVTVRFFKHADLRYIKDPLLPFEYLANPAVSLAMALFFFNLFLSLSKEEGAAEPQQA